MNNISLCRSLDIVLRNFDTATEKSEDASDRFRTRIAGCIPSLMKLMSTSKDRAILTFVLCSIFSPTSLALTLGMRTQITQGMMVKVNNFLSEMDNKQVQVELEAEKHIDNLICTLETELESGLNELTRKRARLHEDECESRMFVTSAKRARLDRLKGTARNSVKKRVANQLFRKWKQNLSTQKGKGKGVYRIDRGAEIAVFEVLQEQLKAHRRRWGDEGTGYLEHDQRMQSREMLKVANDYLAKHGKKPIKSRETVRSWGRCKNKRYRQAQQHRGRNLWAHLRAPKKQRECHINMHYNRSHIKNYTRLAFGGAKNLLAERGLVIRRAIDDKAYVRCGTSEGFSRPVHTPVNLNTGNDVNQFQLPSSDYPDPVGYVSPGVVLLINDMKEIDHEGKDKFVPTNVTVTVTCKPKHSYPSTATNWANDLTTTRYLFRKEHEVPSDNSSEESSLLNKASLQDAMIYLVVIRDSLLQFELMTIKEDYGRIFEAGDHLDRERMRNEILRKRLDTCMAAIDQYRRDPVIGKLMEDLQVLVEQLRAIGMYIVFISIKCIAVI